MQYLKHYYVIDSAKMLQLEIGRELIQAAKHLNRMNRLEVYPISHQHLTKTESELNEKL